MKNEEWEWLRRVPPKAMEQLVYWRDAARTDYGVLSRKQDPDFWEMFDAIEAELERRKDGSDAKEKTS